MRQGCRAGHHTEGEGHEFPGRQSTAGRHEWYGQRLEAGKRLRWFEHPHLVQLLQFRNPLHRVTIDELRNESESLLVGHPENRDQVGNDQHDVLSYLGPGNGPHSA